MQVSLIIDHNSKIDLFHQLSNNRTVCQICGKTGNSIVDIDCFHYLDYSYQGWFLPQDLAAMVAVTNAAF